MVCGVMDCASISGSLMDGSGCSECYLPDYIVWTVKLAFSGVGQGILVLTLTLKLCSFRAILCSRSEITIPLTIDSL